MLQSDLKRAKEISSHLKTLSGNVVKSPIRIPAKKSWQGEVVVGPAGKNGADGKTPTREEITSLIKEVATEFIKPVTSEEFVITPEMVRDIVRMMHQLPENDRLDVQGIRNFQSFVFGGTRYKPQELMHGGANAQASGTSVTDENVASEGSGTSFTLAHTPIANTLKLYRGGSRVTVTNGDYTISGPVITLASSLGVGETLTADYTYV